MILKRIGVASCAKLMGILYAAAGFLIGLLLTFLALLGTALGSWAGEPGSGLWSLLFGMGAIITLPVLYGFMGAIGGVIGAALYNLVAHLVGGVELDLEPRTGQAGFVRPGETA